MDGLLGLDEDEIHLWCARPCAVGDDSVFHRYASLLSEDERERHQAFRFERHRREYLLTRALARTTLSHYLPLAPGDWRFRPNAYGKPAIAPPCGLRFNLSNSPGLVVCLVARCGEVGVDVEPWQRAGDILEVAAEVFSAPELAQFHALAGQSRADRGLSLWTLKEAYIKARGMGLSLPPQEFSFLFDGLGRIRLVLAPALADSPGRWRFGITDHAGHRIAMVAEQPHAAALRLKIWEARPLLETPNVLAEKRLDCGFVVNTPG